MSKNYFLGIDIGTFESKGVITGPEGNVIASHACPHIMESPKPGYAEHDALKTWWADFCEISNTLLEKSNIEPHEIKAVCCSTIAPCCLPVDKECNPLRKAILYGVDVRASKEIAFLEDCYGKENIFEKYGTPITSQSVGAKLLWLNNNEPEVHKAAYKFVTGTTFLVAKLTGNYVIDKYTAAAWVPMYDIKNNDWEYSNLDMFCRHEQLPECRWTTEVVGTINKKASKETGLLEGTPVATGTADAAAEAISAGVFEPGDMLLMYGSTIFIIHVVNKFTSDKRLWANPYLFPGTYSVTAGMSTTGTLTRWFRDNLAKDLLTIEKNEGINAYSLLADEAKDIPAGSEGLIVLPYFSGERTPINDPKAKGVIFGLSLSHSRAHIYNACLEGIGYGVSQHFDIFEEMKLGTKKVMAVGGGTKNDKWLQTVSDISGKVQHTVEEAIGAAYGDALLAATSIGFYKDNAEIAEIIKQKKTIRPNKEITKKYSSYKLKYAKLYQLTKDLMHEL